MCFSLIIDGFCLRSFFQVIRQKQLCQYADALFMRKQEKHVHQCFYHHWCSSSLTHTNTLNDLNLLCTSTLDSTAPLRSGLNVVLARCPGSTKTFTVWKDNAGGQKGDGRRWIFSCVIKRWKHERLLSMNRWRRRGYFSPLIHSNKHSPELFGAQWSVFEILQVFIRLRHRVRNVFTF